jgi:hypothetical protein
VETKHDQERDAAWELYVELATRIAVVPRRGGEGLIRVALTSLYSLFDTTRGILRQYGPVLARPRPAGEYSFGQLAMRGEIEQTRQRLGAYADLLAVAAGVPPLTSYPNT